MARAFPSLACSLRVNRLRVAPDLSGLLTLRHVARCHYGGARDVNRWDASDKMQPSPQPDPEFVKGARSRLKLSQAAFGEQLGLDRRTIIRYEQGDPLPVQTKLAMQYLLAMKRKRKHVNGES